ncbi:MAG TPA: diguanylate cyclase [Aromatoleum sp.]|uniref:sensor domain-containing diguanylate cyclase n=1 Tax=Aromatoleum sp. TaxID=2307007 RepID=UPI002B45F3AC|nr:diguanylate cyclase [Aromatoleum sp.]HJV24989.1 diguanylate cyclase [Aromatoleum sp.]
MRLLRDAPIQWKLTLIIMLTCGVAVVLGVAALALRYVAAEQENLTRHMAILTRMVATNATSALAFGDQEWARRALAALEAEPEVCAADVFDADGKVFASFRTPCARQGETALDPTAEESRPPGLLLLADSLRVVQPIVLDEERIGTVVLMAGLEPLRADLLVDAVGLLCIVLVAGLVAFFFASRLQKFVSEPIRRLAATMKHVSAVKDYARHVESAGNDEIGELIRGFNEMLDQIRLRDEQLQRNVTERAKAAEVLRIHAKALENTVDSVMVLDADRHIVWVNKAFTLMTGYEREAVLGQAPELLESDRHARAFYDDIWSQAGQWQGEVWSRRRNGDIFPQRLSISPIRDQGGQISHYVSVGNDISPYKQYEAQLEHLAHHDTLTQLANRGRFETQLDETLARARRLGGCGAVMFVDLDHFKAVNDTCGHAVGDQLLRAASERIRQCVRESDLVARLGGDEFAVLLDGLSSSSVATKIAGNLVASLAAPFNIAGKELHISSSIGICCYPEHGSDADELVRNADLAMYCIKEAGRNGFRLYSPELAAASPLTEDAAPVAG